MSPISSPEGVWQAEEIREAVEEAVEVALAPLRAGQRELEARLGRLEVAIRELQLSDQARAASFSSTVAAAAPPMRPHQPTLPLGAPVGATTAVMPAMAQPVAVVAAPTAPPPPVVAAVAPSPLAPVHALPPQAAPQPVYVPRPRLPSYDEEPFDINMLPGGLDMGRRKRAMAFIAFALLVIVLGGLVAMAIASQATHGL